MSRKRQIKINGVMRDFDELRTLKSAELTSAGLTGDNDILEQRWRYKKNGDVEFFTGDPGADDIVFGGSKSDLRRIEELERNISVLATKVVTASSTSDYDSDDDNYDNVFDSGTRFKNSVRFSDAQVIFDGTSTLTIDTNTFHVDSTNNRVGIGTTSPTEELDVTGDGAFSGNVTITGNLTVNGTTTTVNSTTVEIQNAFVFEGATADAYETTLTVTDPTADRTITLPDATGTVVLQDSTDTLSNKTLASPTVTGNVAFDTNTLFVDSTNNRVGIGTTSPAVGLDFQMINSGEGFRVRRHNASDQYIEITEGDGSRHEIKANGTKEFRITNTTANAAQGFHFFRNSAERLRILGDGLITFQDGAGTVAFTSDLYTNSDVDAHLNQSNPTSGYVLSWNGSDYAWVAQSSGGGTYTAQSSAPSSPSAGDEWYDTDTGDFYKYINDGTTSQWVEWSPGSGGAQLDGTTEITGTITPGTDNTYALGSSSKKFSAVYSTSFEGTATSAQYADLAEMYAGDQAYEPGTVVVVGGTHEVTQCTKHLDSSLAGVVSEKPGYLMNKDIDAEYPVCVGFVGRVPVKVIGHIEKGDLLTTSSIPGFATKYSKGSYEPGCIIGVALNTKQEIGEGIVEVLLKRS